MIPGAPGSLGSPADEPPGAKVPRQDTLQHLSPLGEVIGAEEGLGAPAGASWGPLGTLVDPTSPCRPPGLLRLPWGPRNPWGPVATGAPGVSWPSISRYKVNSVSRKKQSDNLIQINRAVSVLRTYINCNLDF